MVDDQIEQANAYHEYFEAVKNFNTANVEYIQSASEIASMRKTAIQKAIEIHINPVMSRVRALQTGSVVLGILSVIFFFVGIDLATRTSNVQTVESVAQTGLGSLLFLGSLGAGFLAVLVFVWTSSKINSLYSNVREAQEKTINPFSE